MSLSRNVSDVSLSRNVSVSSEESLCAICLEEKTGFIAQLSCGHTYHYSCAQSWIKKKNNLKRVCCICDKDTEIVALIGNEPPTKISNNFNYDLFACCSIL